MKQWWISRAEVEHVPVQHDALVVYSKAVCKERHPCSATCWMSGVADWHGQYSQAKGMQVAI